MGETHDNLMKGTFDTLLTSPNTVFRQCFQLENTNWQGGAKMHNFEQLSTVAKSICNNMINSGTWNAADAKDAQILAFHVKIK